MILELCAVDLKDLGQEDDRTGHTQYLGTAARGKQFKRKACSTYPESTSEETLLIHRPGRKLDLVAALTDSSALIGRSCPVRGPANWMLGAGIILPWIGESSNCNLHRAYQAASVFHNYNAA